MYCAKVVRSHGFFVRLARKAYSKMAHVQSETTDFSGMCLKDHTFSVPLDWAHQNSSPKTNVYVREIRGESSQNKYLLFLQGGPGFESPRPLNLSGWTKAAVANGYTILFLDQRGVGRSNAITIQSLPAADPNKQAEYLSHFRADSIVKDCEYIREQLGIQKWTLLGQSFGGFVATTYLSFSPEGLDRVMITGGLPPLISSPDLAYQKCSRKVIERTKLYYERYPGDVEIVKEIVRFIEKNGGAVDLPSGSKLTSRGFQSIGLQLGFSEGFEKMHYALENPFVSINGSLTLSYLFLKQMDSFHSFDTNPIYAFLHESIYCQGNESNWSAERVISGIPEFNPQESLKANKPILFTGEMIFPYMFEEMKYLSPFYEAAKILAKKKDWPKLYDEAQLKKNVVPVVAAVYEHDMYVDKELSLKTAETILGAQAWVTPDYLHNGLRSHGQIIFEHLLKLSNR